jgi:hypothetical protein
MRSLACRGGVQGVAVAVRRWAAPVTITPNADESSLFISQFNKTLRSLSLEDNTFLDS